MERILDDNHEEDNYWVVQDNLEFLLNSMSDITVELFMGQKFLSENENSRAGLTQFKL